MKKKAFNHLQLKKSVVSNLQYTLMKGGGDTYTGECCASAPFMSTCKHTCDTIIQ